MDTLGRHVIAELDGCDAELLSDCATVRHLLLEAARRANAKALADETFDFQEGGVSGFVLLAESHISIHTWPEHHYAAIDIYTCGCHTMPEKACSFLADRLRTSQVQMTALDRGVSGRSGGHEHRMGTALRGAVVPTLVNLPNSA